MRNEGVEYSYGKMHGGVVFGFLDSATFTFPEIDPRVGQLQV